MTLQLSDIPEDCMYTILTYLPTHDLIKLLYYFPHWSELIQRVLKSTTCLVISNLNDGSAKGAVPLSTLYKIPLNTLLSYLPNIENIKIEGDGLSTYPVVSEIGVGERLHLKELNLHHCRHMTYSSFKRMIDNVPNLEVFRHTSWQYDYEPMREMAEPDYRLGIWMFEDCCRGLAKHARNKLLGKCLYYLLRNAKNLHTLDLSDNYCLTSSMFRYMKSKLISFTARGCPNITSYIIGWHLKPCSRDTLEILDLTDSFSMLRFSIETLSLFGNLRILRLPPSRDHDDGYCFYPPSEMTEIGSLARLVHLEELRLDGYCIHGDDLRHMVSGCEQLHTLQILGSEGSHNDICNPDASVIGYFKHLKKLEITGKQLNDENLNAWFKAGQLQELESVKLVNTLVTPRGIRYLVYLCPFLNEITLNGETDMSEKNLKSSVHSLLHGCCKKWKVRRTSASECGQISISLRSSEKDVRDTWREAMCHKYNKYEIFKLQLPCNTVINVK